MTSTDMKLDEFSDIARLFFEHRQLASKIIPFAIDAKSNDGAHDLAHIARVWANARRIAEVEGGDLEVIVAAVILHDCVAVEKNSPLRKKASFLAAERATEILQSIGWSDDRCSLVAHAIQAHSFSADVKPQPLEACIVQDADRLDAIGLIGVARCFYTAGRMGTELYNVSDPKGDSRELQDRCFALDHFPAKLLKLSANFRTKQGAKIARLRHQLLIDFYNGFLDELAGNGCVDS
ncbi:HD domain-containing protein [Pusillimonas sp. ANT_WB101]|uniref:HD domain-containing protein n=1 Tax=Pusillimonas sp. ANT_WB101 TaxID=2597356 RepID=UPI00210606EA|nr:HD domain-containing protein [Pusillimonas sp. ANT_WB101]